MLLLQYLRGSVCYNFSVRLFSRPLRKFNRHPDFSVHQLLPISNNMLRTRRIAVTVTQCGVVVKPRMMCSFRSGSGSAAADVVVEKVVPQIRSARPNVFALFPWREVALPPNGIVKTLRNMLSIVFVSLTTVDKTISGSRTKYKDFIEGGEAAFRCATDSIFFHQLMEKHRQQVNTLAGGSVAPEARDVADLPEIFGDELQAFYRYAIEQHCLKSTYHCTYSLERVRSVTISSMEYIKGTIKDRTEKYYKNDHGPGLATLVLAKYMGKNLFAATREEINTLLKDTKRCVNMSESTVRVWLDVECTEVFAIRDVATGAVVQGTLLPRQVTHQILMENVINLHESRYTKDWTIVDIDNWLEGNQFWIADKLHPPSQ